MSNHITAIEITLNSSKGIDATITIYVNENWESEEQRMAHFQKDARTSLKMAVHSTLINNSLIRLMINNGLFELPTEIIVKDMSVLINTKV